MTETIGKRLLRKKATKEDIKHLLEEVWEWEEDDVFYKIFALTAKRGIRCVLHQPKEELEAVIWKEKDGAETAIHG